METELFWKLRLYIWRNLPYILFIHFSFFVKMKYKEAGKKGVSSALYSTLPETLETQHAKEASELQSQVPQFTHQPNVSEVSIHLVIGSKPVYINRGIAFPTWCKL